MGRRRKIRAKPGMELSITLKKLAQILKVTPDKLRERMSEGSSTLVLSAGETNTLRNRYGTLPQVGGLSIIAKELPLTELIIKEPEKRVFSKKPMDEEDTGDIIDEYIEDLCSDKDSEKAKQRIVELAKTSPPRHVARKIIFLLEKNGIRETCKNILIELAKEYPTVKNLLEYWKDEPREQFKKRKILDKVLEYAGY